MLVERYLTELMTTHFGHILADLDTQKMRVSAWKGAVELENIEFRKDALQALLGSCSPVEIAHGTIGTLTVRIPWKAVRNQLLRGENISQDDPSVATHILVKNVSIIITPCKRTRQRQQQQNQPDEQNEEISSVVAEENDESMSSQPLSDVEQAVLKQQSVQTAMDAELLQRVTESSQPFLQHQTENFSSSNKNIDTWKWKIQERAKAIFSNLGLTIQNVHIRYEDPGHCMGFEWNEVDDMHAPVSYRPSFAVGVTLQEFSMRAAAAGTPNNNNNADPNSAVETSSLQRKIAAIEKLAVYWDSDIPIISKQHHGNRSALQQAFSALNHGLFESTNHDDNNLFRHSFVLDPFSPSIQIGLSMQQCTPSVMDLSLPPCRITLSRSLLEDMGYIRKSVAVWLRTRKGLSLSEQTLRRLTRLRPQKSASEDPASWWRYAYTAVLALREEDVRNHDVMQQKSKTTSRRPKGWLGLARALGLRRRYVDLYKDFLLQNDPEHKAAAHAKLLEMEKTLPINEIVAFRIACFSEIGDQDSESSNESKLIWDMILQSSNLTTPRADGTLMSYDGKTASLLNDDDPASMLSMDRRSAMFIEMVVALNREKRNITLQQTLQKEIDIAGSLPSEDVSSVNGDEVWGDISWNTSLKCSELSLQVDDVVFDSKGQTKREPVIRISCAFAQNQSLYQDGSWEMTNRIGALVVKDCTSINELDKNVTIFPNLLGSRMDVSPVHEGDKMEAGGSDCPQSVSMRIRRKRKGVIGSVTTTEIRVLPMKLVYSTAPVESLTRILGAANVELLDDYHRIANSMSAWRERQKRRLLRALAHKQKEIFVEIDVGAPVLLIPEDNIRESPLLILDLGDLHFSNDLSSDASSGFDDRWRLEMTSIQVQCSSTFLYRGMAEAHHIPNENQFAVLANDKIHRRQTVQQLIEPFSLNFAIFTKISSGETGDSAGDASSVRILATLPRLAFNISSSSIRLLRRLQNQWRARKQKHSVPSSSIRLDRNPETNKNTFQIMRPSGANVGGSRKLEFQFTAPLFSVKLENDVDKGPFWRTNTLSFPLFDFSLKGTESMIIRETSLHGITQIYWKARIRTLAVVDLYQKAGAEYCFLLSSVSPDIVIGRLGVNLSSSELHSSVNDLVTFEYTSVEGDELTAKPDSAFGFPDSANKLSLNFNELYVEWNPETLAAINKAVRLPAHEVEQCTKEMCSQSFEKSSEEEFFDAEEEAFYDAFASLSDASSNDINVFEENISSSTPDCGPSTGLESISTTRTEYTRVPPICQSEVQLSAGPQQYPSKPEPPPAPQKFFRPNARQFTVSFKLSKLRVNFNKEVRHRRLITAEMDETLVRYSTLSKGGSKTTATIGNLTFLDCESLRNKTLYREILGLKTESRSLSSVLQMEMIMKPRLRQTIPIEEEPTDDPSISIDKPVSIDYERGIIVGFDNHLRARFSPMRFVYLQQLWFEFVDYFFTGIISNEVLGTTTDFKSIATPLGGYKGVSSEAISFTKFDVVMDSPVVLFPVSSCSTDYIKLAASSISFRNHHTIGPMRHPTLHFLTEGGNQQWYNNCAIEVNYIVLSAWSGNNLNNSQSPPTVHLSLCWPIGSSAPVNVPKWKVECNFDALTLSLDQTDYALLQNIVQYNIGDESHHLHEWYALQSLPSHVRARYDQSLVVHYGYDQKDGAPSTFDVTVNVPVISFSLKYNGPEFADIRCSNVCWQYEKFDDRVSKQKVACDIQILDLQSEKTILSAGGSHRKCPDDDIEEFFGMQYTTQTEPSGNNKKTLSITEGNIQVAHSAWYGLTIFFQCLPEPTFLSPNEAIQVGDRWYRIGGNRSTQSPDLSINPSLEWIKVFEPQPKMMYSKANRLTSPSYEFRLQLLRPSIWLGFEDKFLMLSIVSVNFHHRGKEGFIHRDLKACGVQLQTHISNRRDRSSDNSLISPWNCAASLDSCNGKKECNCKTHSYEVKADVLNGRAAFSDLVVAIDICRKYLNEVDESHSKFPKPPQSIDQSNGNASINDKINCNFPICKAFHVDWHGVRLVVADDTGRHFVSEQDLVVLFIHSLSFSWQEKRATLKSSTHEASNELKLMTQHLMELSFSAVDVLDCLQSDLSPFRRVLAIRPSPSGAATNSNTNCDEERTIADYAVKVWSSISEKKIYGADCRSIEIQYNPSMVVALQRFLGRLLKESRNKNDDLFRKTTIPSRDKATSRSSEDIVDIQGKMDIHHLFLCLNKEHQGRRLLESTLSNLSFGFERSTRGYLVDGQIGALNANDPSCESCLAGKFMRSSEEVEDFLTFQYKTFSSRVIDYNNSFPPWILSQIGQDGRIDDCLEISMAAIDFVFLRDRTEELLDYLSNGMPGKGMGATSRAAKEFVTDRMQKKSFLCIHVASPNLIVPRGKGYPSSFSVRLGDLNLKSWYSSSDSEDETSRTLKIILTGVSATLYQSVRQSENYLLSNLDICVDVKIGKGCNNISCQLSDVSFLLSYSDYVTVLSIIQDNIGQKVDKKNWDNVEAAWEKESGVEKTDSLHFSTEVAYSKNARLVRYGQVKGSSVSGKTILIDLWFGKLSVLLRCDDHSDNSNSSDLMLLELQDFKVDVGERKDGDQWVNASLRKVFVFDLGRRRRLNYKAQSEDFKGSDDCGIAVIIEGYSPLESPKKFKVGAGLDSQIVLKLERGLAGATKASVIVSYLSLNACLTPLSEFVNFFACRWNVSDEPKNGFESCTVNSTSTDPSNGAVTSTRRSNFEFKFVLHYPRLVFVADENDIHSKALVSQGLAIVNVQLQAFDEDRNMAKIDGVCRSLKVDADFQDISSYISSDVSEFLVVRELHSGIIKIALPQQDRSHEDTESNNAIAITRNAEVPLLLPLTVGLEFEQVENAPGEKVRSLSMNIDPISIMLSNEDLQLIKSVAANLSSSNKSGVSERALHSYKVVFRGERLGLGLRKVSGRIVVDNVRDTELKSIIQTGDAIVSVNEETIDYTTDVSFTDVIERLASESRPLTLTFSRTETQQEGHLDSSSHRTSTLEISDSSPYSNRTSIDKLDVSLAAAVLTLMEKEVPLFRGSISTSKSTCQFSRGENSKIDSRFSTSIGIDYYNLRIWGWEPFVEPGVVFLSTSYHNPAKGPKELSVEIGDDSSGLSINFTDSLGETLSKLLLWREEAKEGFETDEMILSDLLADRNRPKTHGSTELASRKAANVALRFATRQKNDTAKPFVFRNKSGLTIAFVQHRRENEEQNRPFSRRTSFEGLGNFSGLQTSEPSEIMVVANNEESRFRVEVTTRTDAKEDPKNVADASYYFPSLTVALQETHDAVTDPFENLQIARPCETLLPLIFYRRNEGGNRVEYSDRKWVSWQVEQIDEKTVLTFGSSIRVCSMLEKALELCVDFGNSEGDGIPPVHSVSIGIVRSGEPFHLPIWLAMQKDRWRCNVRLVGNYKFTPLFQVSPIGQVSLYQTTANCIECISLSDDIPSAWLTITKEEKDISIITIDCSLSVRNMLPSDIEWEVCTENSNGFSVIDGSTVRKSLSGNSSMLKSGEHAEVLSTLNEFMKVRFQIATFSNWSAWIPITLSGIDPVKRQNENDSNTEKQMEDLVSVFVRDAFGIFLPLGLRIARKSCGMDVTFYADIWCTNCTPLEVVFGCPMRHLTKNTEAQDAADQKTTEISTAEATLKEISATVESRSQDLFNDFVRLPGQVSECIIEECFEYFEVESSKMIRHWWAMENPLMPKENWTALELGSDNCEWIDKNWFIDLAGSTLDGWESSPNLFGFSPKRVFHPSHRYRRRRWIRTRRGLCDSFLVQGVNAFLQTSPAKKRRNREPKDRIHDICIAVQVEGGKWSVTSLIPPQGNCYGVLKAPKARWPEAIQGSSADSAMFELCYSVSSLEGDWGLLTRSLVVTSRFLLRNDSSAITFEVKQCGSSDKTVTELMPGQTAPFHWGDYRLPQLISIRPTIKIGGRYVYKWSGGFDPLTIGPVPLRMRSVRGLIANTDDACQSLLRSIKVEVAIRPRTGGTGINLCFQEENNQGEGSLFRIENLTPFPIWYAQDGVLVNPVADVGEENIGNGDLLAPGGSTVFALDVPYRPGKYSHRQAETMTVLLRSRLSLAPLSSRSGIETTKVISLLSDGERIRLNPTRLSLFRPELKSALENIRVLGTIINDGPTRVLLFSTMEYKTGNDSSAAIMDSSWFESPPNAPTFVKMIIDGAAEVLERKKTCYLPSEEEVIREASSLRSQVRREEDVSKDSRSLETKNDMIVSIRAAFSGLIISLVDSAPSEIAVISVKNMNAIATWDMMRMTDSTVYVTVTGLQVDNHVPNSPFPVAVYPFEQMRASVRADDSASSEHSPPLLVVGLSFAPRHKSGIVCLKSATVAPRNLAIRVDLAFIVRLQKFILDMQEHFQQGDQRWTGNIQPPNLKRLLNELEEAALSGVGRQKFYFGGLTILPCNIKLSVAPARALTPAQAALEGAELSAIHQAVRKGDILLAGKNAGFLGVRIGKRNKTPLAVVRGMFKSFVVDGLLRLDGASINFTGVSLRNHTSTGPQLTTALSAHYMASLRQNLPNLLGSMAAFGNPLGLVRGLGEGVGDFVLEPVRGFQRSVQEMDATYLVDGVARGTISLARHTVGGFADSAAMLAETFSKNMTVLTLDRRYMQKRDRGDALRDHDDINVATGLGSGMQKLVTGFLDGVTGVVKAPIRGAEKSGLEGFAKGIGKGLLGLLVKPIIGISDGFTDVMIGVKGSVEGSSGHTSQLVQVRPRRALYGREKAIRPFQIADAAASALMLRTRLAGEPYLGHVDMNDRVALLSVNRLLILGRRGEELLILKLKHVESVDVRSLPQEDGTSGWGIVVLLNTPRRNGSEVEVISCKEKSHAIDLCFLIEKGMKLASLDFESSNHP